MTTTAAAAAAAQLFRVKSEPAGAPPEVSLVSVYPITNGSLIDIQSAIDGTVVGTWTSISTGSLVVGDAGTSIYKGGSTTAHITLPASQAAHNLGELSLSFYYQPSAHTVKHTLFALGDGTTAGDLSIEVLTNGRLRGFHCGQDSALRFFGTTAGLPATNLQVGTAYRITLTLGTTGTRLYLDDVLVSTIPQNINGWNNARVKYIGIWTDGVQSPLEGAIDQIRIWSGELQASGIAALEDAQSITFPATLAVPSLATWLTSDESDPTPTKYVSNQNRGNGSGSSPGNAQEVQAALSGASAGQIFLAVCQTPGTVEFWDYPSGLTFPSGTSGSRITLQARQGDGVVISRGEDFAGARTPSSGFWTQSGLAQADIDKKIWRSVSTFSGGAEAMMGWWIEFNHPHQIVRASSMTNLRATYSSSDSPTGYAGPSVHKDTDGRVYIRFQIPHPSKYSTDNKWSVQTWPGHPEAVSAGKLVYPISEDPNDYVIHLTRVDTTTRAFNTGQWLKIGAGINSMGHRYAVASSNIWLGRGLHYNWHSFLEASATGNTRTNFFLNRVRASDGSKLHLSRAEWKFGGWLEPIRSAFLRAQDNSTMNNIYCKDCTIGDYHEIIVGNSGVDQFRFRNCTFVNIYDDGMQTRHNASRHEWGYCYFYNSAYGGLGQSGAEGDDPNPGGWFIHHNIMDNRQERGTNWRAQPHPNKVYNGHSPDGRSPRKTYNNLIIFGPDMEEEFDLGLAHCPAGTDNTFTGATLMHEVFNNILLRVFLEGTKRYDAISSLGGAYSDSLQNRSDYAIGDRAAGRIRYSASFSNELFDYNLYWRSAGMSVNGLLRNYGRGTGQTAFSFDTLADWKAHAEFAHSKLSGTYRGAYTPGFDGNSTETAPTIPTLDTYPNDRFNYRPSPTSAVTTAASGSLSGANWWTTPPTWGATYFPWNDGVITLSPSAWKGALDPNGSTLPVGVQNP